MEHNNTVIGFGNPGIMFCQNQQVTQDYQEPYSQSGASAPQYGFQNLEINSDYSGQIPIGFSTAMAGIRQVESPQTSCFFITNNWFEEQQSWCPHPSPQAPINGQMNLMPSEPLSAQQGTWGLQIGFENFQDAESNVNIVHYHNIDNHPNYHVDPMLYTAAFTEGIRRSHTIHHDPRSGGQGFASRGSERRSSDTTLLRHQSISESGFYSSQSVYPKRSYEVKDCRIQLLEKSQNTSNLSMFCTAVKSLRGRYPASDAESNSGRIWSIALRLPNDFRDETTMKMTIFKDSEQQVLHWIQKDTVTVEDLIAEILNRNQYPASQPLYPPLQNQYPPLQNQYPSLQNVYPSLEPWNIPQSVPPSQPSLYPSLEALPNYVSQTPPSLFQPQQEITQQKLHSDPKTKGWRLSICGLDEYLQNMYSLRSHIALLRLNSVQLRLRTDTSPGLARTSEDDQLELDLSENLEHAHYWKQSKERIANAVGQYGHFAECLLRNQLSVHNLLEAVKEICYLLRSVETKAIKNALTSLLSVNLQATPAWTSPHSQVPVQNALLQLSDAIAHLINIYSRSFQTDFHAAEPHGINRDVCPAIADPYFKFHLYAVHNLPENWLKSNVYFLSCSVIYAGRKLCPETRTQNKSVTKSLFSLVIWDEVISFPFTLHSLPYESMLILKLWGVKEASANGSFLAWTCLPLYSRQMMVQGNLLLNMISHMELPPVTTPAAFDLALPTLLTVQVDFPERNHIFNKPAPEELAYGSRTPFEDSSRHLDTLIHRNSVLFLSEADKRYLWNFRSCCDKPEDILPLLLGSAPGWDPPNISAMYQVLMDWDFTDPLEALGLLNSCFSDQQIRETACQQIGKLPNDELLQYLPQFVQAIKFEWDLDNALVRLLLQRSLQSVQIAHHLYWLLTDATNESHYKSMYEKLLAALQFCVGKAMNDEFLKQKRLVKTLQQIAEKVKGVQETKRQETLQANLNTLERFFQEVQVCRLPLDPAIVVKGIDRSKCSFFKSNALPLKVCFISADPLGQNVNVIFKIGDDLRQDMLVLQMIEVMDRIWLKEGLDLHMITYRCLSTGNKQGLIQMVPDSTTLAKIHEKYGMFSPFKEGTIKKWYNASYTPEKVSENFLFSCAGWCVATFLLGVCDRHNDNIMLTDCGHMFHIDFGKFMGHAQKFGTINRDRAPFIFTNEMEYFITEGGTNPERSQEFVDLCCIAYNVLRRYSPLLINLLELMLQAGLPELRDVQDLSYMQNNLRPQDSDIQATSYFTKKIQESLECFPVKLNNFIHILANTSLTDKASLIRPSLPNARKVLQNLTKAGVRKLHEKSERLLNKLGNTAYHQSYAGTLRDHNQRASIQLCLSFKDPELSVLVKHLKNVHFSTASIEICLLSNLGKTSVQRVKSHKSSSALTFNKIVKFYVPQSDRHELQVVVKSKDVFLGSVNILLNQVHFNEDLWYPLTNSTT